MLRRKRQALAAVLLAYAGLADALPPAEKIMLSAPVYDSNETIMLPAYLYRVEGKGPQPAIVDLHGCNGIWPVRSRPWLEHYLDWGFAVLQVDSFSPRGFSNICASLFAVPTWHRARDAHAAKRWLQQQPWVREAEIFLTGFSHGATTTLLALEDDLNAREPFAGAVAIAPWCLDQLNNTHTDLLILIGGQDQWTPAHRCEDMRATRPERVDLVIYENAFHSFDVPGLNAIYQGYQVAYDARAAQQAVLRAREFFLQRRSVDPRRGE